MTDRDKLIELLKGAETKVAEALTRPLELEEWLGIYADYLLANGVIVPPCKVGDYVRFKGLTSLWQVDAIHYYREGLPQITVTNGKVTSTITDFETFEVVTKEQAEEKLKECDNNINRLQEKNERLERENKHYAELEQGCYVTGYKNIKAEAYKECIEKVKALFPSDNEPYQYWEIHEGADNLLKELVGE